MLSKKDFAGVSRAALIQDQVSMRNLDSKNPLIRIRLFHSNSTVTALRGKQTSAGIASAQAGDARGFPFSTT
jgi:hypothetical protein